MPRLAVLGQPIAHSRSPAMHTAALRAMGLSGEWTYEPIEVIPEGFESLVRSLPARGFAGVNVTVPHKLAALALSDEASRAAGEVGAANMLTFRDGRILAGNTDVTGITESLPRSAAGIRTLVWGAGGSARAAVWALREAGAEVSIWNRTAERAQALAHELGVTAWEGCSRNAYEDDFDLLLNATTVGMAEANPDLYWGQASASRGDSDLKISLPGADAISATKVVVDLVYGTNETMLARAARDAGATLVDGFDVLVRQGAASLAVWVGTQPPLDEMRRAARST